MITRITTFNGDAYQITAIVFDNGLFEVVEVVYIPLVGRPTVVQFDTLPCELQDKLETLLRQ